IARLVPLVALRAVALIAIALVAVAEAAFLELVATSLETALAFARSSVAACTRNSSADHETLFASAAFFDRTAELVRLRGCDFETGFVVENLDRTDIALRHITRLADERQQPFRIGAMLAASGDREPHAVKRRI